MTFRLGLSLPLGLVLGLLAGPGSTQSVEAAPTQQPVPDVTTSFEDCMSGLPVYRWGEAGSETVVVAVAEGAGTPMWADEDINGDPALLGSVAAIPDVSLFVFNHSRTRDAWPPRHDELAEFLTCAHQAHGQPVHVIGHSTGGLALAAALNQDPAVPAAVEQAFGLGVPWNGSDFVRALNTEDPDQFSSQAWLEERCQAASQRHRMLYPSLRQQRPCRALLDIADTALNWPLSGPGNSRHRIEEVIGTWPEEVPLWSLAGDLRFEESGRVSRADTVGDGLVSTESALTEPTHLGAGDRAVIRCPSELLTPHTSPCFTENLPRNPEMTRQIVERIRGRDPDTGGAGLYEDAYVVYCGGERQVAHMGEGQGEGGGSARGSYLVTYDDGSVLGATVDDVAVLRNADDPDLPVTGLVIVTCWQGDTPQEYAASEGQDYLFAYIPSSSGGWDYHAGPVVATRIFRDQVDDELLTTDPDSPASAESEREGVSVPLFPPEDAPSYYSEQNRLMTDPGTFDADPGAPDYFRTLWNVDPSLSDPFEPEWDMAMAAPQPLEGRREGRPQL